MRVPSRIPGLAFLLFGVALLGWLLYDPTNVQATLGLESFVSEAVVVLAGFLVVAASLGLGVLYWRKALREAIA
jgi:hypothetical protein